MTQHLADPRLSDRGAEPTTPHGLAFPRVHLNGTSKDELERQLRETHEAVQEAIRKLSDACPNARDYYVQHGQAFKLASEQYRARLAKLTQVRDEIEEIWEGVNDQ